MRSPAGMLELATWVFGVVPTGMLLIGPVISSEMRLCAISHEMVGSDESDPLAVGLTCPLCCCGAAVPAATAATATASYVATPSG